MKSEEDYHLNEETSQNIVWYNNERPLKTRILYSSPTVIGGLIIALLLFNLKEVRAKPITSYEIIGVVLALLMGFLLMFFYFSDRTPKASRPWRVGISENGVTLDFWKRYKAFYPWKDMQRVRAPFGYYELQLKNGPIVGMYRLSKDVRSLVMYEYFKRFQDTRDIK